MNRSSHYQPGLAWFAAVGSAWVFVLVTLGAFTTSIGAGMVFADWPLSNGSINPHGWLEDVAMFAEHSHRLTGTLMGLITISLAVWLQAAEQRAWLRRLGWWALGIVVVQGLLGGTRVKLDAVAVPGFAMTLGQMLRIPHGILAQVYVCALFAIAAGLSRPWVEAEAGPVAGPRVRRLGWWLVLLLFVQLTVAATMRHNAAGLAIPTFPWSTPEGGLLPAHWDFRIGIHFAHRCMALVLTGLIVAYAAALWRDPAVSPAVKWLGAALIVLLAAQITLGAQVVWSGRNPYLTTAHVIVGALLLATAFLSAFVTRRHTVEGGAAPAP